MAENQNTKEITPYTNIAYVEMEPEPANDDLTRVRSLQAGFGSKVLRVDRQGLWLGAEQFANAPFSVDMEGNVVASSIIITGYIPTGGALSDIGAGNITSTYIGANAITTSKIAANAVTANEIAAGSVTASKISVSELSAISADIGSVTAGTLTGTLIRTSSSGSRVQISGSTDDIRIYDSGGDLRMILDQGNLIFYDTTGVDEIAHIYVSSDDLWIDGNWDDLGSNVVISCGSLGQIRLFDSTVNLMVLDQTVIEMLDDRYELNQNRFMPTTAGDKDLGSSVDYWDEVNYKTLTDRGCIPFYDEGVELRDGRKVSDVASLKEIKPHPTFKTPAGRVRLDYRTMPKDVYRQAVHPDTGELLPRDENDRPYIMRENRKTGKMEKVFAEDGAETTALIGILVGSIKELDARLEKVEVGDK